MKSQFGIIAVISALATASSLAIPIAAPGTEGNLVIASGGTVTAKYEGSTAGYTSLLYLERLADGSAGMDGIFGNDLFIFNNHASAVGSTLGLGSFGSGTELVFRLQVITVPNNFYTGPASRNSDLHLHARVQNNWLPSTTLVSFEDLANTPEGLSGFNDLSFSFTNTNSVSSSVPDGGTSAGLMMMGLAALGAIRRKLS